MRVTGIIADLAADDLARSRDFYAGFLGLDDEEFNLGWVARFTSPETGATLQVVTADATAPESPAVSVKVDDVDEAHAEARRRGLEIVHPLTDEEWGVRRFFVRDPAGNVVNIVQHRD